MTTDPREWLQEVQGRANNATEGPWRASLLDGVDYEDGSSSHRGGIYPDAQGAPPVLVTMSVDRRNGIFIAGARTEHPAMAAALTAVLDLHKPMEVYEFDHMNGAWKLDADGEKVQTDTLCTGCLTPDEEQDLEDCEWEPSMGTVQYPCPTVRAITEHLPGGHHGNV